MHDDVEDDDPFRYGQPALHRKYGVAAAVNVGDYLIGLGYRLAAAQRGALGAEATADILAQFADAHTRLCEGQGAELSWRDAPEQDLTPLEALKISALKTAPAFEAALMAGVRLAGPTAAYREPIAPLRPPPRRGLPDPQRPRRLAAAAAARGGPGGSDLLAGRPTVLWALALANLPPQRPPASWRSLAWPTRSRGPRCTVEPGPPALRSRPGCSARRPPWSPSITPAPERPPIISPGTLAAPALFPGRRHPRPPSAGTVPLTCSLSHLAAMNIVHLAAGAGPMYCGSCLHGNTLAAALRGVGGRGAAGAALHAAADRRGERRRRPRRLRRHQRLFAAALGPVPPHALVVGPPAGPPCPAPLGEPPRRRHRGRKTPAR